MSQNNKVNLVDLFGGLQNQMLAQLNTNREIIKHPTSKGDSLENVWIEWLRKYLPNRYCIDKAIVIDSTGSLSEQIDIVIFDQQYTPFVFTQNGIHYIPAEGVYAVFEVKPDLQGTVDGLNYIEYAGKKIASVRSLKRTSTNIIDRGTPYPPRPLTKIVGGILTSTCSIAKNETIEKHLSNLDGLASMDMGCSIELGSFYIDYDGEESQSTKDFNQRIQEYYKKRKFASFRLSKKEKSLVSFFLQLMRYLQQSIGTVAAIDLAAYADAIDYDLDKKL
jgi:hypothetical protein